MTPKAAAAIHARAMRVPAPWDAKTIEDLAAQSGAIFLAGDGGFLLGRVAADEAEILTLAVDPVRQRTGIARRLLAEFLDEICALGASQCFLEVAETNGAAKALYAGAGFEQVGLRKSYYHQTDGPHIDAIVMCKRLLTA